MGRLFGTDGVRGIANVDLTPELACSLGEAGAYVLSGKNEGKNPVVVIGRDTRISGTMLEDGLSAGIQAMGGKAIKLGVLPTPAVAFLARDMGADCGIVISASHNPYEYNGIKFFNGEGYKLDDSIEDEIECIVLGESADSARVHGARIGSCEEVKSKALNRYVDRLAGDMSISLGGVKVVLDCANGAAYEAAKLLFESLGAKIIMLGNEPNGVNINEGVGSTHPEAMCAAVVQHGADIGLSFDGDADRLIAADENGNLIDGDKIMYICAYAMKKRGELPKNLLTATVMSNIGLKLALKEAEIDFQIADVGDRYVLELMQKTGGVIGGEQSGHIIFLDRNTTGDGLYAALRLIESLDILGMSASEAASLVSIYPQVLENAKVNKARKDLWRSDPEICIAIEKTEKKYSGEGRVLIRPSGTEPLVRVMIEGPSEEDAARDARELAALIEKKLGC